MRRYLAIISVILPVVTPHPVLAARCGVHCALPVKRVIVVPAVTIVEIAVPVAAVSFSYLPADKPASSPIQQFAAEPFDSLAQGHTAAAAGLLAARCYRCHGQKAAGNVRLWNPAGDLQVTKAGDPLPKTVILEVVQSGRMPPDRGLPLAEKELIASWALQ
jgi:uncharacterized membrane protein